MRRVLFVDHAFHQKTRSSDFFVEILSSTFKVTKLYIEPRETTVLEDIDTSNVDIVVIWQMDYLAPLFLSRGLPTVVVPMYDGSALMPNGHWQCAAEAKFVSFSFHLHESIRRAGGNSLLVKFYPEVPEKLVVDYSELNGFIWERCPQSNINWKLFDYLCGSKLSSLHIHQAPDDPEAVDMFSSYPADLPYPVSTSKWFEDSSELRRIVDRCNIFMAPRPAEGIGMAFLEAMSRGCCVLAHDLPTHNEYIFNWVNGVLFNKDSPSPITYLNAEELGRCARQSVIEGRATWLNRDVGRIIDFVDDAIKPTKTSLYFGKNTINSLVNSYVKGTDSYNSFLKINDEIIRQVSGIEVKNKKLYRDDWSNKVVPMFELDSDVITDVFNFESLSDGCAWIKQHDGRIYVPLERLAQGEAALLIFELKVGFLTEAQDLSVLINDENVGSVRVESPHGFVRFRCSIPLAARAGHTICIRLMHGTETARSMSPPTHSAFGISKLGIFDLASSPLSDILSLEETALLSFPDLHARRQYVIWCLNLGLQVTSQSAYARFSGEPGIEEDGAAISWRKMREGVVRHHLTRHTNAIWDARSRKFHSILGEVGYHAMMDQTLIQRKDVATAFDLNDPIGFAGFLGWYYLLRGAESNSDSDIHPEEISWLKSPCVGSGDKPILLLNRIGYCIWAMRQDLQAAFDIGTLEGVQGMIAWLENHGRQEYAQLNGYLV